MAPIKVLYVAGWGRSGSTILSNILGEIPGFFSTGEINNLWQRGLIENKLCGCQRPFLECDCWSAIINQAFGGVDQIDPYQIKKYATLLTNTDLFLRWFSGNEKRFATKYQDYLPILQRLYSATQSVSGCNFIVDSSKNPTHGYILSQTPDIDLYVIHLIRSPYGVAHSLMKKKVYDDDLRQPIYMEQHGPLRSTLIWSTWNLLIERLWQRNDRYLRVRYEDLLHSPQLTIRNILQFCQVENAKLPFVSEHDVCLGMNHNVSGNPSRFKTGRVHLALDDEWHSSLKLQHKLMIDFLCFPLLWRYGYLALGQNNQDLPAVLPHTGKK